MTRWISEYIDQNTERWKTEKQQRMKTEAERAEDWKKMKRFEKIEILKEQALERSKKNPTVTIKTSKLSNIHLCNQAEPQPGHGQQDAKEEDQAEQNAAQGNIQQEA